MDCYILHPLLAVSPAVVRSNTDGVAMQVLATASGDKTVRLWSLADGACLRTFEGHSASALRCCFLSAGTQVFILLSNVQHANAKLDDCMRS